MELTTLALLVCGINLSFPSPLGDDLVPVDDKACRFWPKVTKLAIECCSVPELFDHDIKETCISECTNPDDPSFNTWCCTINCIFEETEIVSDGTFDGERAKEVLTEAFEDSKKIVKSLDGIVDTCEKQASSVALKPTTGDEGKNECETPQYGYIISCIHRDLFKLCPEVNKKDAECKQIKEFMEKCPHRSPPFKQTSVSPNRTKAEKDNLADAMKDIVKSKDKDKDKSD